MGSLAEEREVRIEDSRSEECDELLKKATAIYTIFNLVILVYENDLPLFSWVDIFAHDLLYGIF